MAGLPADLRAAADLGGEMGQRVLGFDWAAHPLGDPEGWSPAVRATVASALACRFPIVLWLGERLRLIYNDAYIPALGDRHPAALGAPGQDVWWDIWDVVGPLMDSVVQTRKATWSDDLKLMLVNDGLRRERYFTFTYSPILGPVGELDGVFCAVTETTERVLSERRLRALNDLAAGLIDIQSVDDALSALIEVSARHAADLPFVAVYGTAEDQPGIRLRGVTPAAAGVLPTRLAALARDAAAAADGLRRVQGLRSRLPALARQMGPDTPDEALVIPLSVASGGMTGGALVAGLNLHRPLDEQYRGFCRLIGDQVSSAIANAVAYEAERRRAESLAQLDRAKTVFLTNISHEFRTPLTLMLGPLEDAIGLEQDNDQKRVRLQRLLDLGAGSPAAAVAAAYQPAGEVTRVGGDWYTATPLGPGRVGISAGDVVGHGLPAAAAMSQLRSALGVAALSAAEPAAVVDLLDRYARTVPDASFATIAYAVVDSAAGVVDYACAGHPYPLIVGPDGVVAWLRDGRQPALAVRSVAAAASAGRHALPPGSLLVLYTDGLIERRGQPLDDGFDRLAAAAADCARLPAGAACAALLTRMSDGEPYADDVAIIAVRPAGTTPTAHVDVLPAALAELAPARHRLRAWLTTLRANTQAIHDVLAVVGEAVCNAIEHGSDFDPRRTVSIEAFAADHAITVTVADSGSWSANTAASRAAHRGRGLKLIHGLSDTVQTVRNTLGTQVTMTYQLDRNATTTGEP